MSSVQNQPVTQTKNDTKPAVVLSPDEQIIAELRAEVSQLKRQLAWFQREVFGQKSERREGDGNPLQLSLGDQFNPQQNDTDTQETENITYERKKKTNKKNFGDSVNDSGLRFTDDVEVKEIRLDVPELMGDNASDYVIISENVTCRLAARPSSYVVLKYIQPVVKFIGQTTEPQTPDTKGQNAHNHNGLSPAQLFSPTMPSSVIEKSYADVSFIAAAMVDKWGYHLPFHRQQQCLQQNGIMLCSGYLVQLMQRVVPLLKPIYQALLDSYLAEQGVGNG